VKGTSTGVEINTQLMCVYDPQCAEPGADPAARCYEQTTCAYKSTPAEASLLQHAPAGCEGLSRTVPSRCPAGVKGTSTGVEINTQLMCVYDPQCAEPGADPAARCYEQTTCAYKSTPAEASLLQHAPAELQMPAPTPAPAQEHDGAPEPALASGSCGNTAFSQCGGMGWPGLTCCPGQCSCVRSDDHYSQCRPADGGSSCSAGAELQMPAPAPPALAAEEITTELLAAEVVNTTTAGFTTGGLADTQDLPCGSDNSNDCVTECNNGLKNFCRRCSNEGGSNPLRNRCPQCYTKC